MKGRYKNFFSFLLVCAIVTISGLTAFADVSSDWKESTVYGYTYEYYSRGEVVWNIPNQRYNLRAMGMVRNAAMKNVPAGYMGVQARLYTSNGTLKLSSSYVYNPIAIINEIAYTSETSSSGYFYSHTQVKLYNGDGYNTYNAYKSPNVVAPTSLDTLMDSYGITKNNETYGSALLAEILGQEPDLILAVGTDGTEGYVKASDLAKTPETPEVAINMGLMSSKDQYIPLYDLEGNVIGEFLLNAVETEK